MMRLYYHPESDSLFLAEPGDWQQEADGALSEDVSDDANWRASAVLDNLEVDQIKPLEYYFPPKEPDDTFDCPLPETPKTYEGVSGAIIASMAKWARKPADLYPTPPDCTISLLHYIKDMLKPGSYVLEPACADGQMSKVLEQFGYKVDSTDLRPDVQYGTGGIDFLGEDSYIPDDYYDAVITNPPFVAAEKFIRRSLEVAPMVCMLLKAQYWNTDNRKKLFRETKPYMELNLTWRPAFLEAERGKSPLMDCAWIIWVRGHDDLPKMDILDRHFSLPLTEESFNGL